MKLQELARKTGRRIVWRLNLPDDKYLEMMFYLELEEHLNLKDPKSFNEKLQWLKLNDRKELYTTLVDKYETGEKIYCANSGSGVCNTNYRCMGLF